MLPPTSLRQEGKTEVPTDQDAEDAAAFDRGYMREHRRVIGHLSQHTDDVDEQPDTEDPVDENEDI